MKDSGQSDIENLRKKAEELLVLQKVTASDVSPTAADMLKLIHELQVYQIELELQNDELNLARQQEESAREKFAGLYDFAPSGYFTLTASGNIAELNLTGAKMLGKERQNLINSNFTLYITFDSKNTFADFLSRTLTGKSLQSCEVSFGSSEDIPIYAHLSGNLTDDGKHCLITAVDITAHKLAELALQESEAKYRQLAENSTSIVYRLLLKPEFKFDYVSPSSTEITGYTPEDHYNDPQLGFKLVHPDDRILLENTAKYTKGEPLELRWIRKDGRVIWTEQRNVLLFDENNEPYAIEGNARDITDRKNIELGLRKETERNSLLLSLFARAVVLTDKELFDQALDIAVKITDSTIGFFHQVSDNQQDIILTTWNDEAKKNCTTVYDNLYPLEKSGNWADCVRQKKVVVYNDYPTSPNRKGLPEGHAPICRIMSVPVIDDDKVRLIFGVGNKSSDYTDSDAIQIQAIANELHKILEKRKVEKNLQKIEDRWQFAIEGSNDGIWDWNVLTNEVFFSNRWKEMIGFKPDELEGKLSEWQTRVHPDDIEAVTLKIQQHFKQETPVYSSEHRILNRDGSWKWILDRGKVLEWTLDGKPARMVGTHTDISDRKKNEEIIRNSEEKFRIVTDNAYNWEFWEGSDGRWIHHSSSCQKLTGYSSDEFLNDNDLLLKIIHPDDREAYKDHHFETKSKKTQGKHFFRIITKKGEIRDIEQVCQAVFDGAKTFIGIRGSNIDITERKLAENQLRESEVQYRNLANAGSALIWTSGTNKLCNYFNEPWLKFTGRTLEQEVGNGWVEGVHPDDIDRCVETYNSAFNIQVPFEMEYRLRHASGDYRWIVDLGTPNFNSRGEFVGYIGHCFDISERKHTELALHESEEKYRNIFESVQEVYFEASMDGTLLEVSPSIEKITRGQFCRNEMIGQPFAGIYANPGDRDIYFSKLFEQKRVNDYELLLLNKDGSIIPVAISSALSYDFNDKPVKITGILRDITERRNAENALKDTLEQLNQANLHLEKRVEERTKEIQEISSLQKAILANAPIAIMTINEAGMYQSINPSGEKMLGYSADEIIGKLNPLAFHDRDEMLKICNERTGADNHTDEEIYRTVLQHMFHKTTEWTWIRKNGEKFPVRITHSSIIDDNGVLHGYMGLIIDITQEKLAIESLRESEERFHSMFYDHAAIMLLIKPESGEIIEANKAAEQFYGLPFNSEPKLLISAINILSLNAIKQEMEDALSQNRNYFVFPHQLASGEIRTVEVHSTPIEVKGEEVLFSIIHDITERKLAENALKKSEAENRAIIQAVPDLMFRIRRDGTLLDSHSQNESSLYVPKAVLAGKKVSEVLPPQLAIQSMQTIEKAFNTGQIEQYEYVLAVQGQDRYYENRIIAISDDEVLSIIRDITQRKESETALKMQSAAFESFALTIIITDIAGCIRWVNSAFTQLTGYSVDEAIGKMPGELVKSGMQDKDFYKRLWGKLLNKEVWSGELINRRKDGSLYYEEETITPVLDSQGNISSFIAIKIDITDRKKLYQDLAHEKRRLADIIRGTNAGTWEWNIQTGETTFNELWAGMLGYTLEEISPVSIETWGKFAHPEDLKTSGELLQKHFKGELDYYSFESRMKHKNGDWIWVLDRGRVHEWDNEGNPLLMSGTHQDITEQKRAEMALLESDRKHNSMISNISDVIGIMSVDGIMQYKSPNIEKYFGWKPEDLVGTNGWLTIHPDDLERIQKEFFDLLQKDNASKTVEYRYKCKDGSFKPIELTAANLVNNHVINGVLLNYHDITVRKQTQEDLIKAKNEAEKANLAKSEFLSRMSHELRTPMNSILGFAQLMEMGEINPKQKKGLTHILTNGKHLLELINEVLDISGIEAGKQVITPEPIKLAGIINEITDSIQVEANKRKVSITLVDSPPGSYFVLADRLRLKQVLINLLNNAIKYNNQGGSITITTVLQPTDHLGNNLVRISICDTGDGIKPEDISKLFQSFERLGASKTKTEGTGLGLMVVKKLTEAMGGKVGVESIEGIGSNFWVEFPLTQDPKQVTLEANGLPSLNVSATKEGNIILYIEDNLSNIELVEDILADHRPDIRLETSVYGKEALKLAKAYKPGLILLDLDLPDIQGIEVLEQLLSDSYTKTIPIIILSADAMQFRIEKLMKAGATDYLTKPLDVVLFMKTIDLHIKM
jgi:PAS domain S-box-containing protein